MLSEEKIKQLYFNTDERMPGALVAEEVDLIAFAHEIEKEVALDYARKERNACIEFVASLNPEVAKKLDAQGIDVIGGSTESARVFIDKQITTWAKVVKDNNIRAE